MRQLKVLYLDQTKDKALVRALSKHGVVFHVMSLNQALFLMAENDFDYYFIDADVPQAQAFLRHVRHDPQLAPPQGVVLLTENDEEDCAAWQVDAFITRKSAASDIPYIFSHLKAEKPEPARILRLADSLSDAEPEPDAEAAVTAPEEEPEVDDIRDHLGKRTTEIADPTRVSIDVDRGSGRSRARIGIVAALIAAAVVCLVVWGPLASKTSKSQGMKSKRKTVDAEATNANDLKKYRETTITSPSSTSTPVASTPQAEPAAGTEVKAATPSPATETQAQQQTQSPEPTPAPAPEPAPEAANRAPSVSISGPSQLVRGQSATYSAGGSDPDGDTVSFSWTSRSFCSDAPGTYSLSVTATDTHGATASDSVSITVI